LHPTAGREDLHAEVMKTPVYKCGVCGRRLKSKLLVLPDWTDEDGVTHKGGAGAQVGWIYSRFTRARYCYVGEGCDKQPLLGRAVAEGSRPK
jgi:hypothetical protein